MLELVRSRCPGRMCSQSAMPLEQEGETEQSPDTSLAGTGSTFQEITGAQIYHSDERSDSETVDILTDVFGASLLGAGGAAFTPPPSKKATLGLSPGNRRQERNHDDLGSKNCEEVESRKYELSIPHWDTVSQTFSEPTRKERYQAFRSFARTFPFLQTPCA